MFARSTYLQMGILTFVIVVCGSAGLYWWHGRAEVAGAAAAYQTPEEADPYVRFDMEGYDAIVANYWIQQGSYEHFNTPELPALFQLAAQQVTGGGTVALATSTRDGVAQMLAGVFDAATSTQEKESEATQMLSLVLATLPPTGRDGLLTSEAQTTLQNTVNNVNPSNDLYADLGLSDGASTQAVAQAYSAKAEALAGTTSPTGQAQLAEVKQAQQVLTNPTDKTIYDQTGAQPTVFSHMVGTHTLYLDISSIAPTTIDEITAALDAATSTPADSLIIDLRGNIGGDLDFAQEFLSLFYGPDEYAFDLYHQGQLEVQRTDGYPASSELARFKQIAVLTDGMTQSTAEVVASALKHDHLASVVGVTTRGWGSVEHLYPLQTVIDPNEQYAVELVIYLTVRYDGQTIEGNGVVPDVDTSNPNWRSELSNVFSSPYLIAAVESEVAKPPAEGN